MEEWQSIYLQKQEETGCSEEQTARKRDKDPVKHYDEQRVKVLLQEHNQRVSTTSYCQ